MSDTFSENLYKASGHIMFSMGLSTWGGVIQWNSGKLKKNDISKVRGFDKWADVAH